MTPSPTSRWIQWTRPLPTLRSPPANDRDRVQLRLYPLHRWHARSHCRHLSRPQLLLHLNTTTYRVHLPVLNRPVKFPALHLPAKIPTQAPRHQALSFNPSPTHIAPSLRPGTSTSPTVHPPPHTTQECTPYQVLCANLEFVGCSMTILPSRLTKDWWTAAPISTSRTTLASSPTFSTPPHFRYRWQSIKIPMGQATAPIMVICLSHGMMGTYSTSNATTAWMQ